MGKPANFIVVNNHPDMLVLKDLGPWNIYFTITNDAENVVERLVKHGGILPNQRLLYYDSEGKLTEIFIKEWKFDGFGPGEIK